MPSAPFVSLSDLLDRLVAGALDPLARLIDPSRRTNLLFLAVAACMALLVRAVRGRARGSAWRFLFPARIWLHRSALLDYRLLFASSVLHATLLWPLALSEVAVTSGVLAWLSSWIGPPEPSALDPAWITALMSVAVFVADDFARFAFHRAAHRIPALWELHKLHHSARVMTPVTLLRSHPLETMLLRVGTRLSTGVTLGAFLWVFPGHVTIWQIGGAYGLGYLWGLLGSNLRHSHVWLSYGPLLEHVFISPAQHQIHHGDRPEQHHRNYGSALAIWDWLTGSLVVTTSLRPALRFGLPPDEKNHDDTVTSALLDPLLAGLRTLRRPGAETTDAGPRRPPDPHPSRLARS